MKNRTVLETKCRDEANKVLKSFYVGAPEEIDLNVIANLCKLSIEHGSIDSCEGRLISNPHGGIIRVGNNQSEERMRFTIAHEIGHYRLHKKVLIIDNQQNLNTWHDQSIETEANIFAAELLMPEFLFVQELRGKTPSLELVNKLSRRYKTSKLASAIQMIEYTNEPCALVYSACGKIKWCKRSHCFAEMGFYIPIHEDLHKYTLAYELSQNQDNSMNMRGKTLAKAWLSGYEENNNNDDVWEDSARYGEDIISIIFVEDDIQKQSYR